MVNEKIVGIIIALLTGTAGVPLFFKAFPEYFGYRVTKNLTDSEKRKRTTEGTKCVLSVILIALCTYALYYCFSRTDSPPSPPTSTLTSTPTPTPTPAPTPTPTPPPSSLPTIKYVENQSRANGMYTGYCNTLNDPEGSGVMLFEDGNKYDGMWSQGKQHGNGKMYYFNGDTYDGQWVNGERHGHGVYTWSNGATYDGNYQNDKINGVGTYKNWTGQIYNNENWTGEYYGNNENDFFHGYGKFIVSNGDTFEGIFKKGQAWSGTYTRSGIDFEIKDGNLVE